MTNPDMKSQDFYQRSLYPIIAAVFCALLLISNIGATKFIDFGFIKTDGGAFLFPLVYILGDILTEVYGFRAARRVIYTGFGLGAIAGLTFWLVQIAPAASDWPNQGAFESILGICSTDCDCEHHRFLIGTTRKLVDFGKD